MRGLVPIATVHPKVGRPRQRHCGLRSTNRLPANAPDQSHTLIMDGICFVSFAATIQILYAQVMQASKQPHEPSFMSDTTSNLGKSGQIAPNTADATCKLRGILCPYKIA